MRKSFLIGSLLFLIIASGVLVQPVKIPMGLTLPVGQRTIITF